MKVLFLEWNGYCNEDFIDACHELGHKVISFSFDPSNYRSDPSYEVSLIQEIQKHQPNYIFTFNYYPVVSKVCHNQDIPYISWLYDSPYITLYSYTTIFPTNHIFVFDKEFAYEFIRNGIKTVHYLPLAANPKRLDQMNRLQFFKNSIHTNKTAISFIGSLYTESNKSGFFRRFDALSSYSKGYIDGVISAQKNVFGYNFVQETLTPRIVKDMQAVCPSMPNPDGVDSDEYAYAQYYINRKITSIERTELITAIATQHPIDVYTYDQSIRIPNVVLHKPVNYYDVAPYVYKCSKINLNISLRSIKSGMPLRVFDIMGAGGFLLSNFQSDFLDYFNPGDDFAFYDSQKDLIEKIDYYLRNDAERIQMAASAHKKIKEAHTFVHRIQEMESYLS